MKKQNSSAWIVGLFLFLVVGMALALPAQAQDSGLTGAMAQVGPLIDEIGEGGEELNNDRELAERIKLVREYIAAKKAGRPVPPRVQVVEKIVQANCPDAAPQKPVERADQGADHNVDPRPEADKPRPKVAQPAPRPIPRSSRYAATTDGPITGPAIKLRGMDAAPGNANFAMIMAGGQNVAVDIGGRTIDMYVGRSRRYVVPVDRGSVWIRGPEQMEVHLHFLQCGRDRHCRVIQTRKFVRSSVHDPNRVSTQSAVRGGLRQ